MTHTLNSKLQTEDKTIQACVTRAVEAASYLGNVMPQLGTFDAVAHGIQLHTSEGLCEEMIEMMVYANQAAKAGVSCLIGQIYYDSESGAATISLRCKVDQDANDVIKDLADRIFSLYRLESGFMGGRNF